MRRVVLFSLCLALCALAPLAGADASRKASKGKARVVLVSVDGLGGEAASKMAFFTSMKKEGAWTFDALAPSLPVTVVSHAAMFTGRPPKENGVKSFEPSSDKLKDWRPLKVGTIFGAAKAKGLATAAWVQKRKLASLLPVEEVGQYGVFKDKSSEVVDWFCAALEGGEADHDLIFLHLNDVDAAGHKHGWGSDEQAKAIGRADARLKEISDCLVEDEGVSGRPTLLIVTADHGGHGKGHGGGDKTEREADRRVPWAARGPGVAQGVELSGVTLEDTAAVIDDALGLGMKDLSGGIPSGLRAP